MIHVSLHDVSPATAPEVETLLGLCQDRGLRPALLVVPDFHGGAPLGGHPEFCARLRALQASGHEVYLHGFSHRSRPRHLGAGAGRPGKLRWLFAQRVLSGSEAEFADLTEAEGEERLLQGERVLQAAGLRIDGFVPPAWARPPWLLPLLARRGYRYSEDHLRIHDPVRGTARPSLVLNFASRSRGRMWSSVVFCRVARPLGALLPARVALHPGDVRSPVLRREVEALLDWARGGEVGRGVELLA